MTINPASRQRSTTPPRSAGVVERAQRNLDRRQRSELERLVELRAIDVGDADARGQPFVVGSAQAHERDVFHGTRGSGACSR